MISDMTTLAVGAWRHNPDYARALAHLQRAEWAEAAAVLGQLQADYPDERELRNLYDETQLRLATEQVQQVQGRRRALPNQRLLFIAALVVVLVALAFSAVRVYHAYIVPSLAQTSQDAQQRALAGQAEQALGTGDYDRALTLYAQLARLNPAFPGLADGRAQAKQAKTLDEAYMLANEQLAAGNLPDAQATLVGIQQIAANYRDVNVLLARIERQQRLNNLLRQAADAVAVRNWDEVVARLEEAYNLLPPAERSSVAADLFDAYLNLAQQVVDGSGGRPLEVQRAVDLFGKALALQPQQTQAAQARGLAQAYLDGYNAVKDGDWNAAIQALEPLYAALPNYLGGEAARVLYNAYMRSGDQYFAERQPEMAWERYYQAAALQGIDTSTARALAANLATHITPTPTTLPSASGTPLPLALRVPAATPEPGNLPLARLKGKIVFTSNRSGQPALWVMDPDGKNAFMLKDQAQARQDYADLRAAETRSPDGRRTVFVTMPANETYPQLFVAEPDGSATRLSTLNGLNADPVWAPTGHWVAFVSNQPGNDEIFLIGADGKNVRRLTNNTFEWDKHPSWSPDGTRLVYWSNQGAGHPQVWLVKEDGSAATNLSHNQYEESDPLWIK